MDLPKIGSKIPHFRIENSPLSEGHVEPKLNIDYPLFWNTAKTKEERQLLNMSQINHIRDLFRTGYNVSEIHATTGVDRKTIRKYLEQDDFSPTPPVKAGGTSIVAPYHDIILGYLEEDSQHWPKQHHTAKRIYERLRDEEGFTGSYDAVQKYVQRLRNDIKSRGTQELVWEPGCAQVDFGEADVYEDTDCIRRKYLTVSYPYSNDGYSQMFGGETAECVCQGLKDIFEFVGGVPTLLVFDNATGVGRRVFDKIKETELFSRFRAHYGFQIRFCNPRAGWEKGNVENKVGTIRRNLFVPVPHYHDIEEYNQTLLKKHTIKAEEKHYKKGTKIADLFEEDKKHFLPLPRKPFDVVRYAEVKADGYGKVCVDEVHHYSTKPENHGKKVFVGIRAHYIDILEPNGDILVRHKRLYGTDRTDTTDASTSLGMLAKNIGAWPNSQFRKSAPELIRNYIDQLPRAAQKSCVELIEELRVQFGYESAIMAIERTIQNNSVNKPDATILAARIADFGIDTPPSPGPSLDVYDEVFLHVIEGGKRGVSV